MLLTHWRRRSSALVLCLVAAAVVAQDRAHTYLDVAAPELVWAQAAAVLDTGTNTMLLSLQGERTWVPASLTKLVTIYTALEAAEQGEFPLEQAEPVRPIAFASAVPPGSSLMFLGPDQRVNGLDLIRGLAVPSGNDAAVEVALRVAGSVSAFNARMNETVYGLGFEEFYFEDAAGLSPANRITASGMARFSAMLIRRWPWLLEDVFSLPEFTYPEPRHYPGGWPGGAIRQFNRNGLVGGYPGADGLKTGFIEASGYNLSATAERAGRRLVVVVLGVPGETHAEGGLRREADARRLLDWGFDAWDDARVEAPAPDALRVWGGRQRQVSPRRPAAMRLVVPAGRSGDITGRLTQEREIWAPAAAGTRVGTVEYRLGDQLLATQELVLEEQLERGGLLRRVWDRLVVWLQGVFGSD